MGDVPWVPLWPVGVESRRTNSAGRKLLWRKSCLGITIGEELGGVCGRWKWSPGNLGKPTWSCEMGERCKPVGVITLSCWMAGSTLGIVSDRWSVRVSWELWFLGLFCCWSSRQLMLCYHRVPPVVFLTVALMSVINSWCLFLFLTCNIFNWRTSGRGEAHWAGRPETSGAPAQTEICRPSFPGWTFISLLSLVLPSSPPALTPGVLSDLTTQAVLPLPTLPPISGCRCY